MTGPGQAVQATAFLACLNESERQRWLRERLRQKTFRRMLQDELAELHQALDTLPTPRRQAR